MGKRKKRGVKAARRRSALRGVLGRKIRSGADRKEVAKAAEALAKSLRPKLDRDEARLARQLAKALRKGRAAVARDPRVRATVRRVIREARVPQEESPWFLNSRIDTLNAYCVKGGDLLSHFLRDKGGIIVDSRNIEIAKNFGSYSDWKAYWKRVRDWQKEITKENKSASVWCLIEDRCNL